MYLGVYITILLLVSWFFSRKQKEEDFLIGGRDRGSWQILLSKFAGAIGAGYFITYTGFAYEYGTGIFAILLGMFLGYLLFGYWAAQKIHKNSKENKFYKIGDFVYHQTKNKFSSKIADWVSNIGLFLWLVVGIVGGSKIISDFGFLSYELAVVLTMFVVVSYLFLAGFKAVLITDVLQAIVILLLLIIVTFGVLGGTTPSSLFKVKTGVLDWGVMIGFFFFGMLEIFSRSPMYQLCYAAKNSKKLKHGIGLAIIPIIIVGFLLLLIGLFMANNAPGIDSGLVFTEALKHFLPSFLLPIAIVLFFAGIMSSADTNIYAISSHYSIGKNKNPLKEIRKSSFILMLILLIISLIFRDVVNISIIAGGVSLVMSFAMIYLIAGGKSYKKFLASTIMGFLAGIIGVLIFGIEPFLAILVIVFSGLGLLWKK